MTSRKSSSNNKLAKLAALALVACAATSAAAAPADASGLHPFLPRMGEQTLDMELGAIDIAAPTYPTPPPQRKVAFKQEVDLAKLAPTAKNLYWTRLRFDLTKTKLRSGNGKGWGANLPGDQIRITGTESGAVQYFNAETLKQWNGHSAFFNGNKVTVELLADPALPAGDKLAVVVSSVVHNTPTGGILKDPIKLPPPNAICTTTDDRRPSQDPRQARMYPPGCTGWAAKTGKKSCMLSAGHCFDGQNVAEKGFVIQANVPQSAAITVDGKPVGIPRHPKPDKQWFIDPASVQYTLRGNGNGNDEDWSFYGTFPNTANGKTFNEAAGREYDLAKVANNKLVPGQVKVGDTITIYGYGAVTASDRKARMLTQQVHSGKVTTLTNYQLKHRADTEGGNSGSAVAIGNSNVAVAIHVLGGCTPSRGTSYNGATLISAPGLQRALANPKGVCA